MIHGWCRHGKIPDNAQIKVPITSVTGTILKVICAQYLVMLCIVWADLMNIFGLPEFEIKPIVYKWAKKTYNISCKVPVSYFHRTLIPTGDTFEVYV